LARNNVVYGGADMGRIVIAWFTIGKQIGFLQLLVGAVAILSLYWVKRAYAS
jgi:hypothetical protein